MDTNICGLNKVVCIDHALEHEGEKVTISNGVNTWEKEITDGVATFLIPSIPAPAKRPYTIELKDVYTTKIELGFGDSIVVGLDTAYEIATKGALEELGLVVGKNTTDIAENKEAIEDNAGAIDTLETLADGLKLNGSGSVFQFALQGTQYGYRIGGVEGEFHPFKTGAESFCYYLGTGNSWNIASECSKILQNYGVNIDYKTLTKANFLAIPRLGSVNDEWNVTQAAAGTLYSTASYSALPVVNYNQSTGALTVSNPTLTTLSTYRGVTHSNVGSISKDVYMIKRFN